VTPSAGRSHAAEALVEVLGIAPVDARRIERAMIRTVLDSFCPVPSGLDTLEQRRRELHADLPHHTQPQLLLERDKLELRLKLDQSPDPWLAERLHRVREALGHAR
jgi:hypothetical protein